MRIELIKNEPDSSIQVTSENKFEKKKKSSSLDSNEGVMDKIESTFGDTTLGINLKCHAYKKDRGVTATICNVF